MKFRRTLLVLTVLAALFTVYADSLGLTRQGLFELLITIEGVVIAELGLYEVLRMSEQTELIIKLHAKKKKMGFSVESENRTIKDAYPMFDGVRCLWEDDDGSLHKVKDLNVGAEPCYFYPLSARTEQLSYCTNIVLTEIKNNRDIFFDHKETKNIPIRIVGDGNETKKTYRLMTFYPMNAEDWDSLLSQSPELFADWRRLDEPHMPLSFSHLLKDEKSSK